MAKSRADIRYARALFLHSEEKGDSATVSQELRMLAGLVRESVDLRGFLSHPLLPADRQEAVIRATFGGKLNPITVDFLSMLAVRRRLKLLSNICERYEDLYLESRNILRISIVTAFDLAKGQVESIQQAMARRYGKQIQAEVTVDAALLGGFVIHVRDTVWDCSVRGKLDALRLAVSGAA